MDSGSSILIRLTENDDNNDQVRSVESVPRERDRIFKVIDVAQVL